MSNLSIAGTIHKIFDREIVSDKFTKRNFVLKIQDGNYEQFANFQLSQDRCDLADNFNEGQSATVHFNIRGKEWNGKYLTNLEAWKIVSESQQLNDARQTNAAKSEPQPAMADVGEPPTDDSLPF